MNLWLRLLSLVVATFLRPKLGPTDVSLLSFRVWPHDLDTSLHMNNGRYWTIMDLGRIDLMIRSGLWRVILRKSWLPVVSAGKVRFRRELRPFQAYTLETRVLTWAQTWVVIQHRLMSRSRSGAEIVNAVALVRVGVYDRKASGFVAIERMLEAIGDLPLAPEPTPEVTAFLAAEEAMKKAE